MTTENELRQELANWSKSLFDRGLSPGSTGNISVKLSDGYLITPTNSCLGFLQPDRIARLDKDFNHVSGDPPSKEVSLHQAFYETKPNTGAVVHLHSTYATAVSCLVGLNPDDCLEAITPYLVMRAGQVKLLPYAMPGDQALGGFIRGLHGETTAVLLANHGPVVAGKDLKSAIYAAEELEEAAKMQFLVGDRPHRLLSQHEKAALTEKFSPKRL